MSHFSRHKWVAGAVVANTYIFSRVASRSDEDIQSKG